MLADVGHDKRFAFRQTPDVVDHVRRVQVAIVGQILDVAYRGVALERVDAREPRGAVARLHERQPFVERLAQVLRDPDVHADVLVELRAIDVDVDLLRGRRVGLEVPGDAIVEPHAERDQQVGFLNRVVHPRLAVHAHHAEVERMRGRDAAEAEQRHRDRDLRALGELDDLALRAGEHHAVAGENQRPLGGGDELDRVAHRSVAGQGFVVRFGEVGLGGRPVDLAAPLLRVLGDVDQHRAGTSPPRDGERLEHRRRDILGGRDEVVVLGDRQRDAGDVGLLECVGANQLAADLSGYAHDC